MYRRSTVRQAGDRPRAGRGARRRGRLVRRRRHRRRRRGRSLRIHRSEARHRSRPSSRRSWCRRSASRTRARCSSPGSASTRARAAIGLVHRVVARRRARRRDRGRRRRAAFVRPEAMASPRRWPGRGLRRSGGAARTRPRHRRTAHERGRARRAARVPRTARPGMARAVIRRLLIANRGEIAIRIARGARELGSRPSASTPTPTRTRCTSKRWTRSVRIGPGPAADSYLDVAEDPRCGAHARRRRGAPGLRLSRGTRRVRASGARRRADLRRTVAGGDRRDG